MTDTNEKPVLYIITREEIDEISSALGETQAKIAYRPLRVLEGVLERRVPDEVSNALLSTTDAPEAPQEVVEPATEESDD